MKKKAISFLVCILMMVSLCAFPAMAADTLNVTVQPVPCYVNVGGNAEFSAYCDASSNDFTAAWEYQTMSDGENVWHPVNEFQTNGYSDGGSSSQDGRINPDGTYQYGSMLTLYGVLGTIQDANIQVRCTFTRGALTASTNAASLFIGGKITVHNGTAYDFAGDDPITSTETGAKVVLQPDERTGETFSKWVINAGNITLSDPNASDATFTFGNEDVELTAEFVPTDYTITCKQSEGGTISTNVSTAHMGDTVSITADVQDGWKLTQLYVNDAAVTGSTFTMGAADAVVTASYEKIAVQPDENGTDSSGSSAGSVHTMAPNTGDPSSAMAWMMLLIGAAVILMKRAAGKIKGQR